MGVDEDGEPRALLETADSDMRSWSEKRFEEYKQEAEPVIGSSVVTEIRS